MVPAIQTASYIIVLLLAAATSVSSRAEDALSITADAPVIAIPERPPGRFALQLPLLEFDLQIGARCAADRAAQSLSINVADTRTALAADAIASGGVTQLNIRIPAEQIPPVVIEKFCVMPEEPRVAPAEAVERITIAAALSLQASLLCTNDNASTMTYASRALDVALECVRPDAATDETSVP